MNQTAYEPTWGNAQEIGPTALWRYSKYLEAV